ncbi:spore coat associated protein CotJA [Clostridium cellulovorans]|uniref:Spore coat associated protein JA (CotJA) n=1 Tax=Clostridium cellulovorans (strain ATCC 35296 / DSM 3052 / OCM 3 / 743B) TaxID=573061 RepID=D9SUW0_CLOC7|nr:spore coat associated protein CotJA [Clostridium cellulovorans]ADL51015.1 hypothetical protein Clocel_1260 [Clostridium cellulovorans 743B]
MDNLPKKTAKELDYGKAYVKYQPFRDLYDLKTALKRGTIFKALDKPKSIQLL